MRRVPLTVFLAAAFAGSCSRAVEPLPFGGHPPAASIEASQDSVLFSALRTARQLAATVYDSDGREIPDARVSWSSDDTRVATVGPNGLVVSRGPGTARVTAAHGSLTAGVTVTVEQELALLELEPTPLNLIAGDSGRLALTGFDPRGFAIAATALPPVVWSSSDETVAAVSVEDPARLSARVAARSRGHAGVTARAGGMEATARVQVFGQPASLSLSPTVLPLFAGRTGVLELSALDSEGAAIAPDALRGVSWSSGDESVATVSCQCPREDLAAAQALAPGTVAVTASVAEPGGHSLTASAQIVVEIRTDREVLEEIYQELDGVRWRDATGWLSDAPLGDWYGVTADAEGTVTGLDLSNNNMFGLFPEALVELTGVRTLLLHGNPLMLGTIPASIGRLTSLTSLRLGSTALTGTIPSTFGQLTALRMLDLADTSLSGPIPPELGNLVQLDTLELWNVPLSGTLPPELGRLTGMERLWIGFTNIEGPVPPELGNLTSATSVFLAANRLSGPLPPELGRLGSLERLWLYGQDLSGSLPAAWTGMTSLEILDVANNNLSGTVPEWTGMANLSAFIADGNQLSGSLAPLVERTGLTRLGVGDNNFAGPLAEFADPASVTILRLGGNQFTGPLPASYSALSALRELDLSDLPGLSGNLPDWTGDLRSLEVLRLADNPGMTGPVTRRLRHLSRMREFNTSGSGLCLPSGDEALLRWYRNLTRARVDPCETPASQAYLVQGVQSLEHPVPLIAGRQALLRVFVASRQATELGLPRVEARFYRGGNRVHEVASPARDGPPIPQYLLEGDLARSVNFEIPGDLIQPGTEFLVHIDPEGALPESLGVTRRIPSSGKIELDVRQPPPLEVMWVPWVWTETLDSAAVAAASDLTGQWETTPLLDDTRTLLPLPEIRPGAHPPVLTSTIDGYRLLAATRLLRLTSGETGVRRWMGLIPGMANELAGLAYRPGLTSVAVLNGFVIAHELGHNLGLQHAPCGGAGGPDEHYPEPDGAIGAWGYDFGEAELVSPSRPDLMGYCGGYWISPYHFNAVLGFRDSPQDDPALPSERGAAPARRQTLVVWGGLDDSGQPYLMPSLVIDARPREPTEDGPYLLEGLDAAGSPVFSRRFGMETAADGTLPGFVFTLPAYPSWKQLARLRLTGPGGRVASIDRSGRGVEPVALIRDSATGRITAFLHGAAAEEAAAGRAELARSGAEVLFGRGTPQNKDW